MNNQPARAALYARISETSAARDKVADQIAQLTRYAAQRNYTIDPDHIFFDDGISALSADTERPGFARLLNATAAGLFDLVLATEEERLARNQIDKAELVDACEVHGVTWETIRDGFVDPATETGEFFSTMRTAVARMESRRKASRQRAANDEKRRGGVPTPGRRCYGYESDNATPREAEAEVVRRMFRHVAAGGSLRSLSQALIAEGIRPTTTGEFTIRRCRDTLRNARYLGDLPHQRQTVRIASSVVVPIVDRELGEAVRSILLDPSRTVTPGPKPRHLLSGLAHCGVCGRAMHQQNGAYRCREIDHVHIRKASLETPVLDALALAFLTGGPELLRADSGVDLGALRGKLTSIEERVVDIAGLIREGLLTRTSARDGLADLKAERLDIERQLDAARAEKTAAAALYEIAHDLLVHDEFDMTEWASMKATVLRRYADLDLDRQREVVKALLHVEVDKPVRRGVPDPRRLRITHLVARHLNPWEEFPADAA
jgi:site-specific DNA recombinase